MVISVCLVVIIGVYCRCKVFWRSLVLSSLLIDWPEPLLVVINILKRECLVRDNGPIDKRVEQKSVDIVKPTDCNSTTPSDRVIHVLTDQNNLE